MFGPNTFAHCCTAAFDPTAVLACILLTPSSQVCSDFEDSSSKFRAAAGGEQGRGDRPAPGPDRRAKGRAGALDRRCRSDILQFRTNKRHSNQTHFLSPHQYLGTVSVFDFYITTPTDESAAGACGTPPEKQNAFPSRSKALHSKGLHKKVPRYTIHGELRQATSRRWVCRDAHLRGSRRGHHQRPGWGWVRGGAVRRSGTAPIAASARCKVVLSCNSTGTVLHKNKTKQGHDITLGLETLAL